jgi:hypothetical protein
LTRRHAEVAAIGYSINACIVLAIGTMGLDVVPLVAAMCCAGLLGGLIIPSREMRWLAVQALRHSLCEECARVNGSASRPIFPQVCMARSERMRGRRHPIEALSINPIFWSMAEPDLAGQVVKLQNEKLAEICAAHPDRFVGLASVALQHPDLAAEQLEYAVKQLGLRGALIGGRCGAS